jgi:hypothetical protein
MKNPVGYTLISLIILSTSCTQNLTVTSPDKQNSISLQLNENGTLYYSVRSHGTDVILQSLMGMELADSMYDFNSGLSFKGIERSPELTQEKRERLTLILDLLKMVNLR